ncbi:MAG: DUF92 domain-containing protein [Acidobacteria bacterium]|nr:DUF92 domain-containing protein [Acidobacteriota bacterium]
MPASIPSRNEDLRQLEHAAPIGFAFLLRYLTWPQALALALLAVAYAALISTRLWPSASRPGEAERGFSPGKLAYALSVFSLVLLFPREQHIVVTVWANLSVGDAVSNVVGRRFGRARLPWNAEKSWAGSAAALAASTLAALALLAWTGFPAPGGSLWTRAWLYAVTTSLVCSLIESVPLPVDDNIAICAAGAPFMVWLSHASRPDPLDVCALGTGAAICVSAALAAYRFKTISAGGAASAVIQGTLVFYSLRLPGFALLVTFFVLGSAFSKLGYRQKDEWGIAQADGARRAARHVWGKGFAAFAAAFAALFVPDSRPAEIAFVAAVAASLYDTTATELGQLWGNRPVLIPSFRPVPRGTRGAVSLEGTILGLLSATLLAAEGVILGLVTGWEGVWVVAAAALAANLESYLAARPAKRASGPLMNAFHTCVAMLVALVPFRF